MNNQIKTSLEELGFSPNEVKVYLAATLLGEASASQIAKKADLPRTTAISILAKMKDDGYLTTHTYRGTTFYWVESLQSLADSLQAKIGEVTKLQALLATMYRSEHHFPEGQICDTKLSIRKLIENLLGNLDKKSVIYTIDTPHEGNYAKLYSDQVESGIAALKVNRGIITKTLVPYGSLKTIEPEKINRQTIELRELSAGIHFESSVWIINDTIIHFSGNPPFAVVINHPKIFSGMKSLFDFFWESAK